MKTIEYLRQKQSSILVGVLLVMLFPVGVYLAFSAKTTEPFVFALKGISGIGLFTGLIILFCVVERFEKIGFLYMNSDTLKGFCVGIIVVALFAFIGYEFGNYTLWRVPHHGGSGGLDIG